MRKDSEEKGSDLEKFKISAVRSLAVGRSTSGAEPHLRILLTPVLHKIISRQITNKTNLSWLKGE